MKRVYLITNKSFYVDFEGVDHQIADYGCLPQMFTSIAKAKKSMMSTWEMYVGTFHYEVTKNYPNGRDDQARLIEEFEMVNPTSGIRTIISLWREWIS